MISVCKCLLIEQTFTKRDYLLDNPIHLPLDFTSTQTSSIPRGGKSRPVCPLQGHHICTEKGKANWEELLAGMVEASVSWFPRWKDGGTGVLCSCEGFLNVPLTGKRGCINYNPILAIRQLGYLMRGHNRKRSLML